MIRRFPRPLSIDVQESLHEESFIANGDVFIKDNVAINSTGIALRNNPKTFTLVYEQLELVSLDEDPHPSPPPTTPTRQFIDFLVQKSFHNVFLLFFYILLTFLCQHAYRVK